MSDARLRELERRYRQARSPEAEAAWLCERVRVGDLERRRLAAAAALGSKGASLAARETCGDHGEVPAIHAGDLLARSRRAPKLLDALEAVAPGAATRVVLAVGRGLLAHHGLQEERGTRALRQAEELLVSDGARLRAKIDRTLREDILLTADDGSHFLSFIHAAAHRLGVAVEVVLRGAGSVVDEAWGTDDHQHMGPTELLGGELFAAGDLVRVVLADELETDPQLAGKSLETFVAAVTDAVRDDLTPWLLGHDDPVLSRVRARAATTPARHARAPRSRTARPSSTAKTPGAARKQGGREKTAAARRKPGPRG